MNRYEIPLGPLYLSYEQVSELVTAMSLWLAENAPKPELVPIDDE